MNISPSQYVAEYAGMTSNLEMNQHLVIALCCCERMIQNYEAYKYWSRKKPKSVWASSLDHVWNYLMYGTQPDQRSMKRAFHQMEKEVEECADDDNNIAEIALLSMEAIQLVFSGIFKTVTIENIHLVIASCLESIETYFVWLGEDIDTDKVESGSFEWIYATPLYRKELQNIDRDIGLIKGNRFTSSLCQSLKEHQARSGIQMLERNLVVITKFKP